MRPLLKEGGVVGGEKGGERKKATARGNGKGKEMGFPLESPENTGLLTLWTQQSETLSGLGTCRTLVCVEDHYRKNKNKMSTEPEAASAQGIHSRSEGPGA